MSRRLLAFFVELFALLTYWKTAGSRKSIVWRDLTPRSAPSIVVVVLRPFVLRMPWVRAHGCEIPLAAIGCQARHLHVVSVSALSPVRGRCSHGHTPRGTGSSGRQQSQRLPRD
jgi:hypothetical protein